MSSILRNCDQCCVAVATVYAGDNIAGGWAGYYCEPCQKALRFQIWDRHKIDIDLVCDTLKP